MKGWYHENYRHSLAARGISSSLLRRKSSFSGIKTSFKIKDWQMVAPSWRSVTTTPDEEDKLGSEGAKSGNVVTYAGERWVLIEPMAGSMWLGRNINTGEVRNIDVSENKPESQFSYAKKHSFAEIDIDELNRGWSFHTGNEVFDDQEGMFTREINYISPQEIIDFLELKGVKTNVRDEEIDYYISKYGSSDLNAPYFVEDSEESGNIAQLHAAERLGIQIIPFLIVRERRLNESYIEYGGTRERMV